MTKPIILAEDLRPYTSQPTQKLSAVSPFNKQASSKNISQKQGLLSLMDTIIHIADGQASELIEQVKLMVKTSDGKQKTVHIDTQHLTPLFDFLCKLQSGQAVSLDASEEVSPEQAANLLRCSRPHVYKLIQQGKLACRMVGSHKRLNKQAVLAYLNQDLQTKRSALKQQAQIDQKYGV